MLYIYTNWAIFICCHITKIYILKEYIILICLRLQIWHKPTVTLFFSGLIKAMY